MASVCRGGPTGRVSGVSGGVPARRAYVDGGPGNDLIGNGSRRHYLGQHYSGGDGDDTIADVFVADGGRGDDDVITGTNQAAGGEGDDTISLQPFYQVTTAPTGDGGPGNDTIDGSGVADVIHGGAGDDTVQGKAGDDQLYGDSGRDKLSGGYGEDALDGGSGKDLCHPDGDTTPTASCEILIPRG